MKLVSISWTDWDPRRLQENWRKEKFLLRLLTMRARAEQPMSQRKVLLTLGILLRLPTSWTAGVNTWGTQLISKPVKNPTRVKRPCTIQKANGRFLRIPTKLSGRRRLPMQQGSQGNRGAALQRWEKWECSPAWCSVPIAAPSCTNAGQPISGAIRNITCVPAIGKAVMYVGRHILSELLSWKN